MRISDWSSDVCSSDLVHGHVVQVVLAGLHFRLVFLADVAHRGQVGVAEGGVVVGVDLAVERGQFAGLEDRQRVELHQRQALLVEQRSEERRVGQEGVSKWRSRWSQDDKTKQKN